MFFVRIPIPRANFIGLHVWTHEAPTGRLVTQCAQIGCLFCSSRSQIGSWVVVSRGPKCKYVGDSFMDPVGTNWTSNDTVGSNVMIFLRCIYGNATHKFSLGSSGLEGPSAYILGFICWTQWAHTYTFLHEHA